MIFQFRPQTQQLFPRPFLSLFAEDHAVRIADANAGKLQALASGNDGLFDQLFGLYRAGKRLGFKGRSAHFDRSCAGVT